MRENVAITWLCAAIFTGCVFTGCMEEPVPAYLPSDGPPPAAANNAAPERPSRPPTPTLPAQPAQPEPIPAPPDVSAVPANAERTESGLAWRVIQAGTGDERPGPTDGVRVHYTGWRAETGEMFDSSVQRGTPQSFTLDRVIAGWTEGLQLMVVGEKRRFWIPANLAYEGRPRNPQGMLVFDVELFAINRVPVTPDNVSAPPENADTSDSGLAWIVLEEGEGERHPAETDRVEVHYAGWRSADGRLFDTSHVRGEPARFPLNRVIDGWTEGVQLMVEGERRRFWIPANLAYEGRPGPQGMLVFDVHLLRIL